MHHNIKPLLNCPGKYLDTFAIVYNCIDDIPRLVFSPSENIISCIGTMVPVVIVYDLIKNAEVLKLPLSMEIAAISSDDSIIAVCDYLRVETWSLNSKCRINCFEIPSSIIADIQISEPGNSCFRFLGESSNIIFAMSNWILVIDAITGAVLNTTRIADHPSIRLLGIEYSDVCTKYCYVDLEHRMARHRKLHMYNKDINFSRVEVQIGPGDYPQMLDGGQFLLISRSESRTTDVWSTTEQRQVQSLPMFFSGTIQSGKNGSLLAYRHEIRSAGTINYVLEIWEVSTGERAYAISGIPFFHPKWSAQSSVIAMVDVAHATGLPSNIKNTIFIDPLSASALGYTCGHTTSGHSAYLQSPSGRWLASIFLTNHISQDSSDLPVGTVCVTDTSPLLPTLPI